MYFEIIGGITHVETFAAGSSIQEIGRLRKLYGRGRWRKRKGIARVRLEDGAVLLAEYTGTKRTELADETSRSSVTSTNENTEDICRLRKEQGLRGFAGKAEDLPGSC